MASRGIIKITQRMLNKSIIDANKSVTAFVKEHLPVDYDHLENGQKVVFQAIFDDGTRTELRMYRRPRGDELLSIKELIKRAKAGDTVTLIDESGDVSGEQYYLRISIKGE